VSVVGVCLSAFLPTRRTLHDVLSGAKVVSARTSRSTRKQWLIPTTLAAVILIAFLVGVATKPVAVTLKPSSAPVTYEDTYRFLGERAKLLSILEMEYQRVGFPGVMVVQDDHYYNAYIANLNQLSTEGVDHGVIRFVNERDQKFNEPPSGVIKWFRDWEQNGYGALEKGDLGPGLATIALVPLFEYFFLHYAHVGGFEKQYKDIERYLRKRYPGEQGIQIADLVRYFDANHFFQEVTSHAQKMGYEGAVPHYPRDLGVLARQKQIVIDEVVTFRPYFLRDIPVSLSRTNFQGKYKASHHSDWFYYRFELPYHTVLYIAGEHTFDVSLYEVLGPIVPIVEKTGVNNQEGFSYTLAPGVYRMGLSGYTEKLMVKISARSL
jgi:hypothetical protein